MNTSDIILCPYFSFVFVLLVKMDNATGNDLENVIDKLLSSAQDLKKKLDSIKESSISDDGSEIATNEKIFQKSNKLRKLEKENEQLKHALEEHQHGLEFIMTKYRAQVVELIKLHKIEKQSTLTPTRNFPLKTERD